MKVNLGQGINVTRKQMTAMASPLSAINPHKYGAGTRLSSAYTQGVNGGKCPAYCRERTSLAYAAWLRGHKECLARRKVCKAGYGCECKQCRGSK